MCLAALCQRQVYSLRLFFWQTEMINEAASSVSGLADILFLVWKELS